MERLVLIARLRGDAYERAQELASAGVAEDASEAPLRGSTLLSESEVVFVIEGDDVELHTSEWFDNPVLSTAIGSWLPLFDGPLHTARAVATWGGSAA